MPTPLDLAAQGRSYTEIAYVAQLQNWRANRELLAMRLFDCGQAIDGSPMRWTRLSATAKAPFYAQAEKIMDGVPQDGLEPI